MRNMKCTCCHHEWIGPTNNCDWCGAPGKVLSVTKPAPLQQLAVMLTPTKPKGATSH